jgi:hypothetical protein
MKREIGFKLTKMGFIINIIRKAYSWFKSMELSMLKTKMDSSGRMAKNMTKENIK